MFKGKRANTFLNAFKGGEVSGVGFLVENFSNRVKVLLELGLLLEIHRSRVVNNASIMDCFEVNFH